VGRIRIVGDASRKEYQLLEETSGEFKIKNASDGVDIIRANSTTITDASGVQLNSHGSRHRADGADPVFMVPFGSDTSVSVSAGGTYTIPRGMYYIKCGASTKAQIYIGGAWTDYGAAGALVLVVSDGANARLLNTGTAPDTSTLRRVA
jgi:hypothetical protein